MPSRVVVTPGTHPGRGRRAATGRLASGPMGAAASPSSPGEGPDGAGDPAPTGSYLGRGAVVAIGIGGMVGGGIFAVLGLSAELTGGGAPVAFAIAGVVALLTASSYSSLSAALPSRGGTVVFIDAAFGRGTFAGGLNVLLWLGYIVMLSLYASAFASYAAELLPWGSGAVVQHLLASGIVVAVTALNLASAGVVGRAEQWIVGLKVAILVLVVVVGITGVTWSRLGPSQWAAPGSLVGGGMVIFVAYEGFELIANAAEDVEHPRRTLSFAYYASVGFVSLLYVLIAIVAVGSLSPAAIDAARDYALAQAARPRLGSTGFAMVGIAAVLSTTSAINATLYGSARLTWSVARAGELPEALERKVWNRPVEGLLITSGLTLVAVNALDLSRIATLGSAAFLLVFAAVNVAAWRLTSSPWPRRVVAGVAAVACLVAVGVLVADVGPGDPVGLAALVALVAGSFALEAVYRRFSGRRLHLAGATAEASRRGAARG